MPAARAAMTDLVAGTASSGPARSAEGQVGGGFDGGVRLVDEGDDGGAGLAGAGGGADEVFGRSGLGDD